MAGITRFWAGLMALLMLSSCYLAPGKFISTLDIRADRSFTFTYKGEVLIADMDRGMLDGMKSDGSGANQSFYEDDAPPIEEEAYYMQIAAKGRAASSPPSAKPEALPEEPGKVSKMRAIADALAKEKGFRSARYLGSGKFEVDYAITSRLDHAFVFPFNVDAQIVLPFFVVELRGDDKVRVHAPGLASDASKTSSGGMGMGMDDIAKGREGSFTLTTDAEILSQNQEDGPINTPRGKQITWNVTPLTKIAPMATVRFPAPR